MDEDTRRRLLDAVRQASERTQAAHAEMMAASSERSEAVRAALEAGVPRARIAEAAGVARTMIYRIASPDSHR